MRPFQILSPVVLGFLCLGGAALADPPTRMANQDQTTASLDLAVPEAPAFAVLDLTPESVVRPTSPRDFATSVLNGVDHNGNFQSGLAIDTSPYMLARGPVFTLDQYQHDIVSRMLARTMLSLATAKGASGDDKSVRIALGASLTPWDTGDPRLDADLLKCLDGVLDQAIEGANKQITGLTGTAEKLITDAKAALAKANAEAAVAPTDKKAEAQKAVDKAKADLTKARSDVDTISGLTGVDADFLKKWKDLPPATRAALAPELVVATQDIIDTIKKQTDTFPAKVDKCRSEAKARNWNASSWQLGGAPKWESESGSIDTVKSTGGAVWTSLSLGQRLDDTLKQRAQAGDMVAKVATLSQLILHVRYRFDSRIPDPNNSGMFLKQDDLFVGGRLRLHSPSNEAFYLNVEGAYMHAHQGNATPKNQDSARFSGGADIRLAKDLWLEISAGGDSGQSSAGTNKGFVLSSFKWSFPTEPGLEKSAFPTTP